MFERWQRSHPAHSQHVSTATWILIGLSKSTSILINQTGTGRDHTSLCGIEKEFWWLGLFALILVLICAHNEMTNGWRRWGMNISHGCETISTLEQWQQPPYNKGTASLTYDALSLSALTSLLVSPPLHVISSFRSEHMELYHQINEKAPCQVGFGLSSMLSHREMSVSIGLTFDLALHTADINNPSPHCPLGTIKWPVEHYKERADHKRPVSMNNQTVYY